MPIKSRVSAAVELAASDPSANAAIRPAGANDGRFRTGASLNVQGLGNAI